LNPTPRNIDREGMGLIDWPEMNKAVGDALDKLTTQWMKPKSIWGMMRALKFFAINCMCVVVGQKLCREMNVKDRCLKGG